ELVLIAAARTIESLYMLPALCRLALFPNVTIIPVVAQNQCLTMAVRGGKPTDHLPDLTADDIVFAAGAPDTVRAVAQIASAAGARCYADPFEASSPGTTSDSNLSPAAWLYDRPDPWRGSHEGRPEFQPAILSAPA